MKVTRGDNSAALSVATLSTLIPSLACVSVYMFPLETQERPRGTFYPPAPHNQCKNL